MKASWVTIQAVTNPSGKANAYSTAARNRLPGCLKRSNYKKAIDNEAQVL